MNINQCWACDELNIFYFLKKREDKPSLKSSASSFLAYSSLKYQCSKIQTKYANILLNDNSANSLTVNSYLASCPFCMAFNNGIPY